VTENQQETSNTNFTLAGEVENLRLSFPEISSIEISTVRGTRLRFPEANQAAPSFVPDHPVSGTFTKPYTGHHELIDVLESRNLGVPDRQNAIVWLRKVGYYRLSGYGLHFRIREQNGRLSDQFQSGTCFEHLIDLYEFDRHLRLLILDAIERIEVAFRERFNDAMAERYGPHWFMEPARFKEKLDSRSGEPVFNHSEFLTKAYEEARRNKESLPIRHYFTSYGDPPLPPCWMLADALSLGTWSKAFGMLADRADQKAVAGFFRSSPPELTSWIHALTNLRNTCAHHSRLWDRRFVIRPSKKGNLRGVVDSNDAFFAQLATVIYCLWSIESGSQWLERFAKLLEAHPSVTLEPMGFPTDWETRLSRLAPTSNATVDVPIPSPEKPKSGSPTPPTT